MNLSRLISAGFGSVALFYCCLTPSAHAVPINGSIGFHGGATVSQGSGLTTLTFTNPLQVDIRQGDYTGVPSGTPVDLAPISWIGSGTAAVLMSNNTPEWTIVLAGATYQYSIIALQAAMFDSTRGALSLQGTGIGTITGAINRDPTISTFSIQGINGQFTFTIVQASTCGCGIPSPTPDGGSAIALLGLTSVGLLALRRRLPVLSSRPACG
jgi:MYXO-CTERM domain-containing protein